MEREQESLSTRDLIPGERGTQADARADGGNGADTPAHGRNGADEFDSTDSGTSVGHGDSEPLLTAETSVGFQRRWEEIQTRFVDQPRGAVEEADSLVAKVMQELAESFATEREQLEAQWARGEEISTEDLRLALQRYRSFFVRLLST